jgi:methylmalonyl-CoA/ethylmalonyl-CoA epimerase
MSGLKVEGVGQIGLTVKDLTKAKAFYGEVLGLPFLFDAGAMAFYQCGGVRLMLGTAEPGKEGPVGGTILYFKVVGIEAVCAKLKAVGVGFVQDAHLVAKMPDHALWMAFVKDSDGNVVGLLEEVR